MILYRVYVEVCFFFFEMGRVEYQKLEQQQSVWRVRDVWGVCFGKKEVFIKYEGWVFSLFWDIYKIQRFRYIKFDLVIVRKRLFF